MDNMDVLYQLNDLIKDRQSFLTGNAADDKVWLADIEALQAASKAVNKQIAKPMKKEQDSCFTVDCPTCGARYGLSSNRCGLDEEYCTYCGQLLSGWNAKVKKKKAGDR